MREKQIDQTQAVNGGKLINEPDSSSLNKGNGANVGNFDEFDFGLVKLAKMLLMCTHMRVAYIYMHISKPC